MKVAFLGDLHVRDTRPEHRIDDVKKVQKKKFKYIMNTCRDEGVSLILQPGDFFDKHTASYALMSEYMDLISYYGIKWGVVFGQHDLRYHSLKTENTPLNVLIKSRHVTQLKPNRPFVYGDVKVWGKSWGMAVPKPKSLDDEHFNILVSHEMVIKNKKLWPQQEDYVQAKNVLRSRKFDLFVFGDNHNHFLHSLAGRHVVNCGSLLRSRIDQRNHHPHFYIFDTGTERLTPYAIPIEPFEQVMDIEGAREKNEKVKSEEAHAFIRKLRETRIEGVNFKHNLQNAIEKNRKTIGKGVIDIIEEALPRRSTWQSQNAM